MTPKRKAPQSKIQKKRTTKDDEVLTKLDHWAISANEVYLACKNAGMTDGNALAFAMDRSSYPDWIVDINDPIRKPWEFDEEDND